jgi:hypothetical protein
VELDGFSGKLAQLMRRVLMVAGLAVAPAAARGDLVGTDDD